MSVWEKIRGSLTKEKFYKFIARENMIIVIKTITYRCMSSFLTFLAATLVTGSPKKGGLVMLIRGAMGIIWYMSHEKIWYKLKKKFKLP
jgi:uncharacterized membrane protein